MKKIALFAGVCLGGLAMVGMIAWLDHRTHASISFYLLYFPAIMMVAWFGGRAAGIIVAIICTGAWASAAWPVLAGLSFPIRTSAILVHVFAMSFVAWMTVALGEARLRRAVVQKKQGEQLYMEMGLARHDHLTGALNRRGLQEKFLEERSKVLRYGGTTSLIHLDLDYFKKINDQYGHQFGDEILKKVVFILRESVREVDSVARTGGDEFVVLLPETEGQRAEICAMRILAHIKETLLKPLSGSIGIVTFGKTAASNLEISHMADEAMYEAKSLGRDQIVMRDLTVEAETSREQIEA